MNNNAKFDPMTGQPLQNNTPQQVTENRPVAQQQPVVPNNISQQVESIEQNQNPVIEQPQTNNIIQEAQPQVQLQSIPTVEQNKQDFINNVQSMNQEKKEEKNEGINFVFIIVLFVIILAAILFLFPILVDYI